jgi:uncharacterized protein
MIVVDTSAILALEDHNDAHHARALAAIGGSGSLVLPAGILAEVDYMVTRRINATAMGPVLRSLDDGSLVLDCGDGDLTRVRGLLERYSDLALGFADAAVVACAERLGAEVLTFDRRDFDVVAGEGTFRVVP